MESTWSLAAEHIFDATPDASYPTLQSQTQTHVDVELSIKIHKHTGAGAARRSLTLALVTRASPRAHGGHTADADLLHSTATDQTTQTYPERRRVDL